MAAEWGQSKLRFKAILLPSFSCHQKLGPKHLPLHSTTGWKEVTLCSKPQPLVSWHGSRGGNLAVLAGKKMVGKKSEPDFIFLPTCLIWGVKKTPQEDGVTQEF